MGQFPTSEARQVPDGWAITLADARIDGFSNHNHRLVTIDNLLTTPERVISDAVLQDFAKISPQYPGVRAALDPAVCAAWLVQLSPLLDQWFGPYGRAWEMQAWYSLVTTPPAALDPAVCTAWLAQFSPLLDQWFGPYGRAWEMQAWYSIVTTPPGALEPIQRLPHVDGTDPTQVAMMLYLHQTGHGGTAFFRHIATGLEALTAADFPHYAAALNADVARTGLPPAAYTTDGAPHFERTHVVPGHFNSAVFYRGNILHSGVIDNAAPLSPDPRAGRLTINAFFRPAGV